MGPLPHFLILMHFFKVPMYVGFSVIPSPAALSSVLAHVGGVTAARLHWLAPQPPAASRLTSHSTQVSRRNDGWSGVMVPAGYSHSGRILPDSLTLSRQVNLLSQH